MTISEQQISMLVVDDEKVVRDIIYRYFTKKGYDVLTTRNGQEALLLGSRGMFDIIILDINMPGMNGLEVLHQLKNKYPNAKVVMLTGVADPESVIQSTNHCNPTGTTDKRTGDQHTGLNYIQAHRA